MKNKYTKNIKLRLISFRLARYSSRFILTTTSSHRHSHTHYLPAGNLNRWTKKKQNLNVRLNAQFAYNKNRIYSNNETKKAPSTRRIGWARRETDRNKNDDTENLSIA